jgi:hypothetical protein
MIGESRWAVRKAPDWRIPSWGIVAYLIIDDVLIGRLGELVRIPPDGVFEKEVYKHLSAYVDKHEMPPDEIAPAILNMADDFMAGREITIRAGDYISLRSFFRSGK